MLLLGPPGGVTDPAWRTAAVAAWMVLWWATEALPLGATSILPVLLFPVLGLADIETTARAYGSSIMFLLLGASLVAVALERAQLHRRLAYHLLALAGGEPRRIVLGLMIATAFISMWVSNLGTALMMLPVALGLADCVEKTGAGERDTRHFSYCLVLGVGYAATIGGMATVVGTPTNGLVAGVVERSTGVPVSFAAWAAFGVPLMVVLVPLAWLLLTRSVFPFKIAADVRLRESMLAAMAPNGPMNSAEKRVLTVFVLLAVAWTTALWWRSFPALAALSDASLAVAAAIVLFLLPAGGDRSEPLLVPADLRRAPWEVLLLLGGSFALSNAMDTSGLAKHLVDALKGLTSIPLPAMVLAVVAIMIVWTEVATNASATATMAPALATLGVAAGIEPALLMLPAALAASCGYMLPIGTPANTAAYATGRVPLADFFRAGLRMDLLALVAIVLAALFLMPWVLLR
jgi:sodium-dependent dicarboxylate transporter 2/3/5